MVKISIIIATWNAGSTLQTCLDSIIPQLNNECELIIIDGDSSDNTKDIISKNIDKISYYLSEKDKGIYDAWNKGIKAARGAWITFIGADDTLYPNALESYLQILRSTENIDSYDYICAKNDFVNESGVVKRIIGGPAEWNIMKKRNGIAHVASLHNKKNLFEKVGYYDIRYKISADYELLLRKKDQLRYLYIDKHIAKMKIGGMSFSTAALKEVYQIRRQHQTIGNIMNVILFVKDVILYKTFNIRKYFKKN